MNYIIDQINEQARNAGSKAREDINDILAEHGYTQHKLSCSYSPAPLSIMRDMHLMDCQLKQSVAQLHEGMHSFFNIPIGVQMLALEKRWLESPTVTASSPLL